MKEKELNKYINQVRELLGSLNQFLHLPHSEIISGVKVTLPQYLALDALEKKGKCMMSDLSSALNIAFSTMTELAGRLAKKDLIKKVRDQKDRRIVWVNFTEKGAKIFKEIKENKQRQLGEILTKLTQAERETLISLLKLVRGTGD